MTSGTGSFFGKTKAGVMACSVTTLRRRGFTLLELVLVMLIIAIVLGAVAPIMNGFYEGRKVNEAAEHFINTARWCRQKAMADAATYQINIDALNRSWQTVVVTGNQQQDAAGDFGGLYTADESVEFSAIGLGNLPLAKMVFEPNGRVDISLLRFTGRRGNVATVTSDSSLGDFRLVEGE